MESVPWNAYYVSAELTPHVTLPLPDGWQERGGQRMKKTKHVSRQFKEWFAQLKRWMSRNSIEMRTLPIEDLHQQIHKLQKQAKGRPIVP